MGSNSVLKGLNDSDDGVLS